MQARKTALAVVCLVIALAIGFVWADRREKNKNELVVRTFNVPANRAEEVRHVLSRLFWQRNGEEQAGVQVFGNGLLVVRAPEGFIRGIEQLINNMDNEKPLERAKIKMEYWLVLGEEAPSSSKPGGEISTVLDTIEKADGPKRFRVLEHLGVNTAANEEVKLKGSVVEWLGVASLKSEEIQLQLDLKSRVAEFKGRTQSKPGEFIVLGQNAVPAGEKLANGSMVMPSHANAYHILRATVLK